MSTFLNYLLVCSPQSVLSLSMHVVSFVPTINVALHNALQHAFTYILSRSVCLCASLTLCICCMCCANMQQALSVLAKYVYHVRPAVRRIVSNIITWLAFQPNIWLVAEQDGSATDGQRITTSVSSATDLSVVPAAAEVCQH